MRDNLPGQANISNFRYYTKNCDALRDLVPFAQFENVINIHGGVLLLVKLQASGGNFTERNTPPWMFFSFLNCTNGTKSRNVSLPKAF